MKIVMIWKFTPFITHTENKTYVGGRNELHNQSYDYTSTGER